jgi:hypothetical protein
MAESNFESALEMLGGESKSVRVDRFGHWACGWFELILVNPKNEAKLTKAYEIRKLLDEYPVLDDTDYYERENEEIESDFDHYRDDFIKTICEFIGVPEDHELTENETKDLEAVAHAVYRDDCAYCGYTDAFVNLESIQRACIRGGCTDNLNYLARLGNEIAEMMIECYAEVSE